MNWMGLAEKSLLVVKDLFFLWWGRGCSYGIMVAG